MADGAEPGVCVCGVDTIPLTALAIKQDGYDWGFLAFAVGYGGSILWFGSSAGVALSNMYPEAKSAGRWLRHGWYVALAYVIAFKALPGTEAVGGSIESRWTHFRSPGWRGAKWIADRHDGAAVLASRA